MYWDVIQLYEAVCLFRIILYQYQSLCDFQVQELIINKDPSLLDNFLDVSKPSAAFLTFCVALNMKDNAYSYIKFNMMDCATDVAETVDTLMLSFWFFVIFIYVKQIKTKL